MAGRFRRGDRGTAHGSVGSGLARCAGAAGEDSEDCDASADDADAPDRCGVHGRPQVEWTVRGDGSPGGTVPCEPGNRLYGHNRLAVVESYCRHVVLTATPLPSRPGRVGTTGGPDGSEWPVSGPLAVVSLRTSRPRSPSEKTQLSRVRVAGRPDVDGKPVVSVRPGGGSPRKFRRTLVEAKAASRDASNALTGMRQAAFPVTKSSTLITPAVSPRGGQHSLGASRSVFTRHAQCPHAVHG